MDKDITPKAVYQLSREDLIEIGDDLQKLIHLLYLVSFVSFIRSSFFNAAEKIDNDSKVNKDEF